MTDREHHRHQQQFRNVVQKKAERRLKAQREQYRVIWYGLAMSGLVGWSVALPTVIGIFLGRWLDRHWDFGFSWTLTCILLGVAIGCLNAWYWIQREQQRRH